MKFKLTVSFFLIAAFVWLQGLENGLNDFDKKLDNKLDKFRLAQNEENNKLKVSIEATQRILVKHKHVYNDGRAEIMGRR